MTLDVSFEEGARRRTGAVAGEGMGVDPSEGSGLTVMDEAIVVWVLRDGRAKMSKGSEWRVVAQLQR